MTRTANARIAGFTYLFYAAIGICSELLMHQARGVDGDAAKLARIGRAGCGFPWSWSVTRWLPGDTALVAPALDEHAAAFDLARFLRALHRPAPQDAPRNS
jgi:hypothetical protein